MCVCVCVLIGISAVYCEKMWLTVITVCQCTVIEFFVKKEQLKFSDCYAYALVLPVSEDGQHEIKMNLKNTHEHVKILCMLQIQ